MTEIPLVRAGDEEARELLHPKFQLVETDDGYLCEAVLPGVVDRDLHVTLVGRTLKVSGRWHLEFKEETEASYAYDSASGGFTRIFHLPEAVSVERATAELGDGVLRIVIPRQDPGAARRISVSGSGE